MSQVLYPAVAMVTATTTLSYHADNDCHVEAPSVYQHPETPNLSTRHAMTLDHCDQPVMTTACVTPQPMPYFSSTVYSEPLGSVLDVSSALPVSPTAPTNNAYFTPQSMSNVDSSMCSDGVNTKHYYENNRFSAPASGLLADVASTLGYGEAAENIVSNFDQGGKTVAGKPYGSISCDATEDTGFVGDGFFRNNQSGWYGCGEHNRLEQRRYSDEVGTAGEYESSGQVSCTEQGHRLMAAADTSSASFSSFQTRADLNIPESFCQSHLHFLSFSEPQSHPEPENGIPSFGTEEDRQSHLFNRSYSPQTHFSGDHTWYETNTDEPVCDYPLTSRTICSTSDHSNFNTIKVITDKKMDSLDNKRNNISQNQRLGRRNFPSGQLSSDGTTDERQQNRNGISEGGRKRKEMTGSLESYFSPPSAFQCYDDPLQNHHHFQHQQHCETRRRKYTKQRTTEFQDQCDKHPQTVHSAVSAKRESFSQCYHQIDPPPPPSLYQHVSELRADTSPELFSPNAGTAIPCNNDRMVSSQNTGNPPSLSSPVHGERMTAPQNKMHPVSIPSPVHAESRTTASQHEIPPVPLPNSTSSTCPQNLAVVAMGRSLHSPHTEKREDASAQADSPVTGASSCAADKGSYGVDVDHLASTGVTVAGFKPRPIIRKRRKIMIPASEKCTDYWQKRKKNNDSAKRSREAKKEKEKNFYRRALELEYENYFLKERLAQVEAQLYSATYPT